MSVAQALVGEMEVTAHEPVLVREVMRVLAAADPGGLLVDGTVGLGGHARAWLEARPTNKVVGLDRDPGAMAQAAQALASYGDRVSLHHADYRDLAELLETENLAPDAILLDLGLGSHQLDDPERGFSFRFDGPLDMRFDTSSPGKTAAEILNQTSEPELARIFAEYGEERAAKKLARFVAEERRAEPFRTTLRFAELVRRVVGSRHQRIDPATRAFQSLRVAVNDELDPLGAALESICEAMQPGSRIAVISFHSLEDRIVKRTFRKLADSCRCRRGDTCTCGALEWLELPERRPIAAEEEEIAANPRSRSARLRFGVRR